MRHWRWMIGICRRIDPFAVIASLPVPLHTECLRSEQIMKHSRPFDLSISDILLTGLNQDLVCRWLLQKKGFIVVNILVLLYELINKWFDRLGPREPIAVVGSWKGLLSNWPYHHFSPQQLRSWFSHIENVKHDKQRKAILQWQMFQSCSLFHSRIDNLKKTRVDEICVVGRYCMFGEGWVWVVRRRVPRL